jgi:protease-4
MSISRNSVFVLGLCVVISSGGCLSSGGKRPSREEPKVPELRELVLTGAEPEEAGGELFSSSRHSHRELLDELDNDAKQPMIKGVFLRLSGMGGAWGRAADLRGALKRVRDAKKPVHCYFDMVDNVAYSVLASSCDRISVEPTGMLMLTGVQAETVYAKDLLDLIGLQAELLQVGKFKGAADALTRSDMPPEVRQTLGALVDDLQASLMAAVETGRKLDAAAVTSAIDNGPLSASAALQRKLVDAIAFDDEARAKAKAAAHAEKVVRALREDEDHKLEISELLKAMFGGKPEKPKGERIALAYLTGQIGESEHDQGSGASSGPFIKAMRRFADDRDVKAVVLRISSPGGSALASDKMWQAVTRVAKRKPLIVSVGDMAASGGYYVACAGSEIFAQSDSIVGSIGVVGGKIVGESLANKLGVHAAALRRGQNAGWMSPFHPFTPSERNALQLAMRETYDTFLSRVHDGRKLDGARLDAVAEGRIMSGKRAQAGGLVDTIGGLPEALASARNKAHLGDEAQVEVWPKERSVLERASHLMSGAESHAQSPVELLLQAFPQLAEAPVVQAWVRGDLSPLAALPYVLNLH